MSEEVESPFAVLDTPIETAAGDSAEDAPSEATAEEAPSEAKAEEKPESEGETEEGKEPAKPEAEPEKKEGEKAEPEPEVQEPIEGEPPKLKEFMTRHKLTGEEKRWLKREVYQNKEYREFFPDPREVKALRSTFPAENDWRAAAEARDGFFRAASDFENNPTAFRDGLKSTNPEAFNRFAEVVAQELPTVAPKARLEIVSDGFVTVFDSLKAEAAKNGVPWEQVSAKDIEDRIFSEGEQPVAPAPDPNVARLAEENRRLRALQENDTKRNMAAVNSVLDARVETAVGKEVKTYVDQFGMDPRTRQGFSEKQREKIAADLSARVMHAYRSTPSNRHAKTSVIDALARSQMGAEAAVASLVARARPELKSLGPDVIRNWTEFIVGGSEKAVAKARATNAERNLTRDIPQMATPSPGPKVNRQDLLKKDRSDFWDTVFGP